MTKATATYTFINQAIIVHIEATSGAFRSFRLDRSRQETKKNLYERAYSEANRWASQNQTRLERFGAQ